MPKPTVVNSTTTGVVISITSPTLRSTVIALIWVLKISEPIYPNKSVFKSEASSTFKFFYRKMFIL